MEAKIIRFRDPDEVEPDKCNFCKKVAPKGKYIKNQRNGRVICFECVGVCNKILEANQKENADG